MRVAISLTLVFVAATSALGVAANVRRIKRDLSFVGYFGAALGVGMTAWCVIAALWLARF